MTNFQVRFSQSVKKSLNFNYQALTVQLHLREFLISMTTRNLNKKTATTCKLIIINNSNNNFSTSSSSINSTFIITITSTAIIWTSNKQHHRSLAKIPSLRHPLLILIISKAKLNWQIKTTWLSNNYRINIRSRFLQHNQLHKTWQTALALVEIFRQILWHSRLKASTIHKLLPRIIGEIYSKNLCKTR